MNTDSKADEMVSAKIDELIKELAGWRGQTMARVRQLIHEVDPEIIEEWKWVTATKPGVPVWSHDGIVCVGESYKAHLKLTFPKGGLIADPSKLFPQYEGGSRRSIDIHETDKLDEAAFRGLIAAAVDLNSSKKKDKK